MVAMNNTHDIERHRNVLVVDNYGEMRHIIADQILRLSHYSVIEAANGVAALKMLDEHPIDYIISNWDMPQLDGIELLQHVRKDAKYQDVPFMLVSSETERSRVELALAAGVDVFMVKPFTARILQQELSRLFGLPRHDATVQLPEQLPLPKTHEIQRTETVLIVDDTPLNIDVISNALHDDYRVLTASSGSKALQLVAKEDIDLILLDIMMPGMDGMEVCRRIKADPLSSVIPIIFLTAKSAVNDIAAGLDAGAVDYIPKPADPRILKARVRAQLALKSEHDRLRQQVDMLVENTHLREDMDRMAQQDLKKPLKVVINTVDALLNAGHELDVEQTIRTERIRNASYEMQSMLDHSLNLYKMETGLYKVQAAPFDIVGLAYRVVEALRSYANDSGISILFDSPDICHVNGEELLTYSLLNNLLKSAIEASPANGHVRVAIVSNDPVLVSIHNEGVISTKIQERFFDRYLNLGKDGGVSTSAYTAKLMAETQGGGLSLRSSAERGTTLLLTLMQGKSS